jgi:hypothetical protein
MSAASMCDCDTLSRLPLPVCHVVLSRVPVRSSTLLIWAHLVHYMGTSIQRGDSQLESAGEYTCGPTCPAARLLEPEDTRTATCAGIPSFKMRSRTYAPITSRHLTICHKQRLFLALHTCSQSTRASVESLDHHPTLRSCHQHCTWSTRI